MNIKIKRWLKRFGQALGILIILTLLAGMTCNLLAKAKLQSVLTAIEKDGLPTSWDAYKVQFHDEQCSSAAQSNLINALNQMAALPGLSEERRKIIPIEGSAKLPDSNQPISTETMTAMRERLDEVQPAVMAMLQAAYLKPWWISTSATNSTGYCSGIVQIRKAARLQVMAAIYHAEKGETDLAIDAIYDALQIAGIPRKGATIIDELVRLACEDMAIRSLEHVLSKTSPSSEQLQRIENFLTPYSETKQGLIGEIIWIQLQNKDMPELCDATEGKWMSWTFGFIGWFSWYEAGLLEHLHQEIVTWSTPWPEKFAFYKFKGVNFGGLDSVIEMYEDMYRGDKKKELRSHGIRDCAKIAVAIRKYSQEKRELPENLTLLTPKYIEKIPAEPFFGKPIFYGRNGKMGVISFSVPDDQKAVEFRVYAR